QTGSSPTRWLIRNQNKQERLGSRRRHGLNRNSSQTLSIVTSHRKAYYVPVRSKGFLGIINPDSPASELSGYAKIIRSDSPLARSAAGKWVGLLTQALGFICQFRRFVNKRQIGRVNLAAVMLVVDG